MMLTMNRSGKKETKKKNKRLGFALQDTQFPQTTDLIFSFSCSSKALSSILSAVPVTWWPVYLSPCRWPTQCPTSSSATNGEFKVVTCDQKSFPNHRVLEVSWNAAWTVHVSSHLHVIGSLCHCNQSHSSTDWIDFESKCSKSYFGFIHRSRWRWSSVRRKIEPLMATVDTVSTGSCYFE